MSTNDELRLYGLYPDAETLWLDPADAVDWWEQEASKGDPPPTLYEHSVRDNRDFFPTGASVAEHMVEMGQEGMGCLFDEELTSIDEDCRFGDAIHDPEVVALLDQAMKLAADRCNYYVAGELLRKIPVVRREDGSLAAADLPVQGEPA